MNKKEFKKLVKETQVDVNLIPKQTPYCYSIDRDRIKNDKTLKEGKLPIIMCPYYVWGKGSARVCHQVPNSNFEIKRQDDIIHATNIDNVGIERHICINFKYATINCNMRIPDDNDKLVNYKVNVAEIHMNASRVVGYIQSVDYLRSKGYALPYNDLSINELIKKGWLRLK